MQLLYLLITLVLLYFTAIRFLRWLSFVQQKEYRLDRFKSFIFTDEGIKELLRLVPTPHDFSRTGLKRPKFTPRIIFVALTSVTLIYIYHASRWSDAYQLRFYLQLLLSYCFLPLWLYIGTMPSSLISYVLTYIELVRAQAKLRNSPTKPKIIGITGSYGKTSTKHLLAHVLSEKYTVFTTPFSYNTKYSVARAIRRDYKNEELIVLEYAAYAKNEIKELCAWFRPDGAIITGLAPQHLELFGSLENIIKAKAELIKALPETGQVIWYKDDLPVKQIIQEGIIKKPISVISATLSAYDVDYKIDTHTGKITLTYKNKKYVTKLIGEQYIAAITLVIATTLGITFPLEKILQKMTTFEPNKNFIQSYTLTNGAYVIDDGGATNPKGAAAAVKMLNHLQYKRKIMVFSGIVDIGKESDKIHRELAHQVKQVADQVWYVGNTGQAVFCNEITSCITEQNKIIEELKNLKASDVILIEGRMPGWFLQELGKLR